MRESACPAAKSGPSSATPTRDARVRRPCARRPAIGAASAAAQRCASRAPGGADRHAAIPAGAVRRSSRRRGSARRSSISTLARSRYMRHALDEMRRRRSASTSSQKASSAQPLRPSAWILPCGDSSAHQHGRPRLGHRIGRSPRRTAASAHPARKSDGNAARRRTDRHCGRSTCGVAAASAKPGRRQSSGS